MAARGTTNSNARGSSKDRLARRKFLLKAYQSNKGEGTARCYRCGKVLTAETITVDRIIPGCQGGKYVRNNIRPACARCNSSTGSTLAARPRATKKRQERDS